jgi:hypothetical protein
MFKDRLSFQECRTSDHQNVVFVFVAKEQFYHSTRIVVLRC